MTMSDWNNEAAFAKARRRSQNVPWDKKPIKPLYMTEGEIELVIEGLDHIIFLAATRRDWGLGEHHEEKRAKAVHLKTLMEIYLRQFKPHTEE